MGLASKITRRSGSSRYYVRACVPLELQPALGIKEKWKSLGTSDPKTAKRLAPAILSHWERGFDLLRAKRSLSDYELQSAIWERYSQLLGSDESNRLSNPTDDDLESIWKILVDEFGESDIGSWRILEGIESLHEEDKRQRAIRLAALKCDAARGETRLVSSAVESMVRARGLHLLPRSQDERRLGHGLQRAEIEALKRAAERDVGEFGGAPTDIVVRPPTANAPVVAALGESIMELFEVFASENPHGVRAQTLEQSRTVIDLLAQFLGRSFPASRLGKKEVREWKTALATFPVKATEMEVFRGMNFRQIVEANKKLGKVAISDKTRNRYLAALGAFCKWLVAHGYLEHIPTTGMLLNIDNSEQKVLPYNTEQLKLIFNSPLFTGCRSASKTHEPGNHQVRDHHFWLPIMSLHSGARMNELCQLLVDDVRQEEGHWLTYITQNDDPAKHLKTKGSKRKVPIHRTLIELGFVDYCQRMKDQKQKCVFPSIALDSRGPRAGKFSKFYGKYIKKIGVKHNKMINFHSFRHSFTDALRRAGYLDDQFKSLLGHTGNNVTGRYGTLVEGSTRKRIELVESVSYPGLDFSHLKNSPA